MMRDPTTSPRRAAPLAEDGPRACGTAQPPTHVEVLRMTYLLVLLGTLVLVCAWLMFVVWLVHTVDPFD